jgi:hypothetical protein
MHCERLCSIVLPHLSNNQQRHLLAKHKKRGDKWPCLLSTKYLFYTKGGIRTTADCPVGFQLKGDEIT